MYKASTIHTYFLMMLLKKIPFSLRWNNNSFIACWLPFFIHYLLVRLLVIAQNISEVFSKWPFFYTVAVLSQLEEHHRAESLDLGRLDQQVCLCFIYLFLIFMLFFSSYSAINPFIYAFYSEDFRAAFYRLTFRRFCLVEKKKPYSYPINSVSRR